MPKMVNDLFYPYRLACTHPGCNGMQLVEQAMTAGWTLDALIPEDPSHPDVGRCPRCKRCKMKVVVAPPPPKPKPPKGFTRIPTE
jgi:hypothetical protein